MKSSLLFGNGINLLNNKTPKWNELLKDINDGDAVPEYAPLTLQYENVLLNKLQIEKKSIKKYDNTYNLYKLTTDDHQDTHSKLLSSLGVKVVYFNESAYRDENNNLNYRQFYKDAILKIRKNSTNHHQN